MATTGGIIYVSAPKTSPHLAEKFTGKNLKGLFLLRQREIWRSEMDRATTLDKGYGRREQRTPRSTTALNTYLDWPGLGQFGQVESEVTRGGKSSNGLSHLITSVPRPLAGAKPLLGWVRGH